MLLENDKALKEWALACELLREGRQILLMRKGGIREEEGRFVPRYTEFFLFPTYEHQNATLLQEAYRARLHEIGLTSPDRHTVSLNAYAVVTDIYLAKNESQVVAAAPFHIWNSEYVRQRFDFNPYDPLYLLVLRVYSLPQPLTLPWSKAYEGCRSWLVLEKRLPIEGAVPALSPTDFEERRQQLRAILESH